MSPSIPILVVEDEDDIRRLVVLHLRREGFDVHEAADGEEALEQARRVRPKVVLLDLNMPKLSGTDVCAALRADPELNAVYVIMLTARSQEADRIEGFLVGADDYVTKPFSPKELVLRVQAAVRRVQRDQDRKPSQVSEMVCGPVRVDLSAYRAFVDGKELELTATEFRLLSWLLEHRGQLCTRGELLQEVWELPPTLNTRTVDTHVKRLRQKLDVAAEYVETVRGAGYRFRGEP